jgi:nucleotide-binding universal stress UspA family protein
MTRILIATDGTASAAEAVELGVELAREEHAVPVFVYVVPQFDTVPSAGFTPAPAIAHEVSDDDREPLAAAEREARKRGLAAETKILIGDAADEIVAFADTIDAQMIVVGSRGHGAFASAVLGSVSRSVLHEARRPVLFARNTKARERATARSA